MPTATQIFRALIQADASGAVKELRKFDGQVEQVSTGTVKKTDKIGAGFKHAGKLAIAAGGAAAVAFGKQAVDAASNLEESINAVNVTFGDSAEGILAIGESAATSLGLSKSEFNGLAVQFSSFAEKVAGPGGDVVAVLDDLTTRAADFASVMNLDVAEAARVFQSGLAGETEPLKRFGIDLSAAAVEAFALENGLAATKKEMTEGIKVQARYGLLMEETQKTAGDFANTSDGLANQQRILSAELENLSAEIGEGLVPVVAELIVMLRSLRTVAESLHLNDIFREAFLEWDDFGLSVGRNIRHFSEWVGVVEGSAHENRKFADSVRAQEQAARDFDRELIKNAKSFADVRAIVIEHTDSLHAANIVANEWAEATGNSRRAQEEAAEAAKAATVEYELQRDAIRSGQHETELIARTLEAKAEADEAAAEATQRHREALQKLNDVVDDTLSSMFDYESATLGLAEAEIELRDKTVETVRVMNDSESSAADKERALIDLRQEQIALAEEVLATAEAFAREQGAADGSVQSFILQAQELDRLKSRFPELTTEIDRYIAELNRIPAVKTTTVTINQNVHRTVSREGITGWVGKSGNLIAGATGGIVTRPTMALIGEAGPEAVIPLNRAPGAAALPTGGVAGSTTIGVVNVYPQSANDTPEAIVDAIRKFERRNGAGWRGAA